MRDQVFDKQFLMSAHDGLSPHVILGRRLHGGINADGRYVSPRSKGRVEALTAWTQALRQRGGDLFPMDASLLEGPMTPNVEQMRHLIRHGFGQIFWNVLTMTGKLEARGRLMAAWDFPDLQSIICQDISHMALGHLGQGLLEAHGLDEGGEPMKGIGGHDVMWFVARDLVFDPGSYPDETLAATIRRPLRNERLMPEIPKEHDAFLSYLLTLMMVETRAEIGFRASQDIFATPDLFLDRRPSADLAAEVIERIRQDEAIHMWFLRLVFGELSMLTFRTEDGGEVSAGVLIERFWHDLIEWAVKEHPRLYAQKQHAAIRDILLRDPRGASVLQAFDALSDVPCEGRHAAAPG